MIKNNCFGLLKDLNAHIRLNFKFVPLRGDNLPEMREREKN